MSSSANLAVLRTAGGFFTAPALAAAVSSSANRADFFSVAAAGCGSLSVLAASANLVARAAFFLFRCCIAIANSVSNANGTKLPGPTGNGVAGTDAEPSADTLGVFVSAAAAAAGVSSPLKCGGAAAAANLCELGVLNSPPPPATPGAYRTDAGVAPYAAAIAATFARCRRAGELGDRNGVCPAAAATAASSSRNCADGDCPWRREAREANSGVRARYICRISLRRGLGIASPPLPPPLPPLKQSPGDPVADVDLAPGSFLRLLLALASDPGSCCGCWGCRCLVGDRTRAPFQNRSLTYAISMAWHATIATVHASSADPIPDGKFQPAPSSTCHVYAAMLRCTAPRTAKKPPGSRVKVPPCVRWSK